MRNLCHSAIETGIDSESEIYKEFIQQSEFQFIFCDSQSYRYCPSGVFADASRVDSKTLVPLVATMSRKLNKMLDPKIDSLNKDKAYEVSRRKKVWFSEEYVFNGN
jgi:hypothetical protein